MFKVKDHEFELTNHVFEVKDHEYEITNHLSRGEESCI